MKLARASSAFVPNIVLGASWAQALETLAKQVVSGGSIQLESVRMEDDIIDVGGVL
jgi:hypothetical protein